MNYDKLKIENQLCFPLYACAKEVVRKYKPFLDDLGITYTQYITMMVLWEYKTMNVKAIGERLFLDSGTLTPLLKKLEAKGYVKRSRSDEDERNLVVSITEEGEKLKDQAICVPDKVGACMPLTPEESMQLYLLLNKMLKSL